MKRIQVYDSNGKFVNGWSFGKGGLLLLGQDGQSIIAVRYNQPSARFDDTGRQLEQWDDAGHYLEVSNARTQHGAWTPAFEDAEGNVYRQEGWILHRIVRIDRSGQKTVIVRDPVYVGIFNHGLAFLLILFSFAAWKLPAVLVTVRRRFAAERINEDFPQKDGKSSSYGSSE